mmetsp:Transcript_50160/g.132581  ORF Transcript_50160/g.132581 Transcript_50160/m.132581 type:complete len:223 (+) Transcript_50160:2191-2859(+)
MVFTSAVAFCSKASRGACVTSICVPSCMTMLISLTAMAARGGLVAASAASTRQAISENSPSFCICFITGLLTTTRSCMLNESRPKLISTCFENSGWLARLASTVKEVVNLRDERLAARPRLVPSARMARPGFSKGAWPCTTMVLRSRLTPKSVSMTLLLMVASRTCSILPAQTGNLSSMRSSTIMMGGQVPQSRVASKISLGGLIGRGGRIMSARTMEPMRR